MFCFTHIYKHLQNQPTLFSTESPACVLFSSGPQLGDRYADHNQHERNGSTMTKRCGGSVYLAVHGSSKAVSNRWLKQLPRPSLIKGDDRSHVVLADWAVDERGDKDTSQPLHAVQVCKWLVGKIPETQKERTWQNSQGFWAKINKQQWLTGHF